MITNTIWMLPVSILHGTEQTYFLTYHLAATFGGKLYSTNSTDFVDSIEFNQEKLEWVDNSFNSRYRFCFHNQNCSVELNLRWSHLLPYTWTQHSCVLLKYGKLRVGIGGSFIFLQFWAKILPNIKCLPQTQGLPPTFWKISDPPQVGPKLKPRFSSDNNLLPLLSLSL